jgi:hypothetical protein
MNDRPVLAVGVMVTAGMAMLMSMPAESDTLESGPSSPVGRAIGALPPSGAGMPMLRTQASPKAPPPGVYFGGAKATGRVAEIYVRVAENVFLAVNQAPEHLRKSAERWVDIEFPNVLANGIGSARAVLDQSEAAVQLGDVVEIKFAHKDNPRYFPVNEVTRVTKLVARSDEILANDFERRILARNVHGAAPPDWLAQAQTLPSSPSPATRASTADARR